MRYAELDIAKGFAVMAMTLVHALMIFGHGNIQESGFADVVYLIGELTGVFILLMGVVYALRPPPFGKTLRRAAGLFGIAYLLNFMKFVVPIWFDILPSAWSTEMRLPEGRDPAFFFFLLGDILHFAAISLALMALLRRLSPSRYLFLVAAAVVTVSAPWLWGLQVGFLPVDHLLGLLWGNDASVYFPVFPWAAFPLLGVYAGDVLHRGEFRARAHLHLVVLGAVLFAAGYVGTEIDPKQWGDFYRMKPWGVTHYLGYVLLILCFARALITILPAFPSSPPIAWVEFAGRHVTWMYLLQWVLIYWGVAIVGYRQLDVGQTAVAALCVFGLSTLLIFISRASSRRSVLNSAVPSPSRSSS